MRGEEVARLLYLACKALVRRYNLRRAMACGRIPRYGGFAGKMTAENYSKP